MASWQFASQSSSRSVSCDFAFNCRLFRLTSRRVSDSLARQPEEERERERDTKTTRQLYVGGACDNTALLFWATSGCAAPVTGWILYGYLTRQSGIWVSLSKLQVSWLIGAADGQCYFLFTRGNRSSPETLQRRVRRN